MENSKKNKHLTQDDRIDIQAGLSHGKNFKEIAEAIGKDPTTVSKEVRLRSRTYTNRFTKTEEVCPLLRKAPYVCNGCPKCNYGSCKHARRKYGGRCGTSGVPYRSGGIQRRESAEQGELL